MVIMLLTLYGVIKLLRFNFFIFLFGRLKSIFPFPWQSCVVPLTLKSCLFFLIIDGVPLYSVEVRQGPFQQASDIGLSIPFVLVQGKFCHVTLYRGMSLAVHVLFLSSLLFSCLS